MYDGNSSLVRCDDCHHSIDSHGGAGCEGRACDCRQTRDGVMDSWMMSALEEQLRLYSSNARKLLGLDGRKDA